jgi:pimeloyl-ACP methyl ester carboxylesterase
LRRGLFAAAVLALAPLLSSCMAFHKGPMPGEPAKARFVDIDGVRVRFTDTGGDDAARPQAPAGAPEDGALASTNDKPVAILVHGFASALDAWATVVPALAKTHRVLALDLKGFGWTDRPEGDYSPDAQARLVLGLMQQRGITKAALVAHSWGSSVALAAVLAAPEKFTKVALYDAWVYEDQLPAFFHWSRQDGVGEVLFGLYYKERTDERIGFAFYDKKLISERLVEDIDAALDRPGTVAAALAAVRGQRYAEVEARYRTVKKPVLLLWGREDLVTPLRFGERLAKDLPNSRLVTYPRCGHFPMLEAMHASNRDLVTFLTQKDGEP